MAEAPGHKLGQIIGDSLEAAIYPVLAKIAETHGLYLDRKGERRARPGLKVTWVDDLGNSHDLDFVLERGGTETKIGSPAAFVETAWRRYTKHSKNKAQEMQGALLPLLARYRNVKPLAAVVVAGEWTGSALLQMQSNGFAVLHIGFKEVVQTFAEFGIDVATGEETSDDHLREQVAKYEALSDDEKLRLGARLAMCAPDEFARFGDALETHMLRKIDRVIVLPLHGAEIVCASAEEAITALSSYSRPESIPQIVRFEIELRYTNGDRITAEFASASDAEEFLRTFSV